MIRAVSGTVQSLYNNTVLGVHSNRICLKFKETILQKNYRKMTILWSFAYNSFFKNSLVKNLAATARPCNIKICVITSCIIKGQFCGKKFGGHSKTV